MELGIPGAKLLSEYPVQLYQSELLCHDYSLGEYNEEIIQHTIASMSRCKLDINLYKQQPYLNLEIRSKLVDFVLKMSTRLKLIPFISFKAIKLFDRYCCKRIVLLDQCQLIITTCLWITAKTEGGNNHFIHLTNNSYRTINELGYGTGGRFHGPTQRYRPPKLNELVKLCGTKCNYTPNMFKQMELHILTTLDWQVNSPSIDDIILSETDYSTIPSMNQPAEYELSRGDVFQVKQYLSHLSLYSPELVNVSLFHLGKIILHLINDVFNFNPFSSNYQTANYDFEFVDSNHRKFIETQLIMAILNSSDLALSQFNSKGPRLLYHRVYHLSVTSFPKSPKSKAVANPPSPSSTFCITKSKSTKPNDRLRKLDPLKLPSFSLYNVSRGSPMHTTARNCLNGSLSSTSYDECDLFDRTTTSSSTPSSQTVTPDMKNILP